MHIKKTIKVNDVSVHVQVITSSIEGTVRKPLRRHHRKIIMVNDVRVHILLINSMIQHIIRKQLR